eukprot:scaffold75046_cov46-Cyclotella_meneghiniana.AAC.1
MLSQLDTYCHCQPRLKEKLRYLTFIISLRRCILEGSHPFVLCCLSGVAATAAPGSQRRAGGLGQYPCSLPMTNDPIQSSYYYYVPAKLSTGGGWLRGAVSLCPGRLSARYPPG